VSEEESEDDDDEGKKKAATSKKPREKKRATVDNERIGLAIHNHCQETYETTKEFIGALMQERPSQAEVSELKHEIKKLRATIKTLEAANKEMVDRQNRILAEFKYSP